MNPTRQPNIQYYLPLLNHLLNIPSTACSLGLNPILLGKYSNQSPRQSSAVIVFRALMYSQYSGYQPHASQPMSPVTVIWVVGISVLVLGVIVLGDGDGGLLLLSCRGCGCGWGVTMIMTFRRSRSACVRTSMWWLEFRYFLIIANCVFSVCLRVDVRKLSNSSSLPMGCPAIRTCRRESLQGRGLPPPNTASTSQVGRGDKCRNPSIRELFDRFFRALSRKCYFDINGSPGIRDMKTNMRFLSGCRRTPCTAGIW